MDWKGQHVKRRKFVELYCTGGEQNPRQCAIDIGVAKKRATKYATALLVDPKVQELIAGYRKELAERNNITQDYFVSRLRGIIERDRDVYENQDGKKVKVQSSASDSNQIAALRLLAEVTGNIKQKDQNQQTMVILKQSGYDDDTVVISEK